MAKQMAQAGIQVATSPSAANKRQERDPSTDQPNAKRVRKHGEEDLAGRELIKDLTTARDKVRALQALSEKDSGPTTNLTQGARTFAMRLLRPAMRCLKDHFDGNVNTFANHWEGKWNNEFSLKCCNGKTRSHLCSSSQLETQTR